MNQFSVGGVLSRSFSIWIKNLIPFFILEGLVLTPALGLLIMARSGKIPVTSQGDALMITLALLAATVIFQFVATGALTYGVFQQLRGEHASIGRCIAVGFSRMLPIIFVGLVSGLLIGLGFLALIIPGLILMCMFYVAVPASVVEKPGIFGAIRRSADLTKGYKGSIFGVIFILWIIGLVVGFVNEALKDDLTVYLVFNVLAQILLSALGSVTNAVVYHDLRAVKEGVAVEELAKVFD